MASKSHRHSHSSQRPSKHKGSSSTDEKRTSSKKTNGYQTPDSTTVLASRTHFSNTSSHEYSPRPEMEVRHQSLSTPTADSAVLAKDHQFAQLRSETQYDYPGHAEYAASVMSGAIGLGVETPPYLQDAIVDRWGQYKSWSVEEGGLSRDFEIPDDLRAHIPCQQTVRYGGGGFGDDFAGIGAQF